MLLVCVELDKIPLLCKLKQLYKRVPVRFSINNAIGNQDGGSGYRVKIMERVIGRLGGEAYCQCFILTA